MKFIPLMLLCGIIAWADNYIKLPPNQKTQTHLIGLPLDRNFKKEIEQYPPNTAFFIDGKTETILSTQTLPSTHLNTPNQASMPKQNAQNMQEKIILLEE